MANTVDPDQTAPIGAVCSGSTLFALYSGRIRAGTFPAILGKGPWPKLGKMINLTSKLGEINDIEHYKGRKILSSKSSYFRLYYAKHTT